MAAPIDNMSVNKHKSSELLALESKGDGNHLESLLDLQKRKKQDVSEKKTFKLPPSSILSQVKDFLPRMEVANKELEDKPAEDVDIEHVSADQEHYIEMSIAMVEQNSDVSSDSDSEHDSDSDSCKSDSEECLVGKVTENNLRLNKKTKHKPDIVELQHPASQGSGTSVHADHKAVVDTG